MRTLITALLLAAASAPAPNGTAASQGAGAASGGAEWLGPRPPATPRRVISLAPSLTDTVVALGKAKALVGVTRYDTAPEVAALPRVGGFLDPSPEAVVALQPDLVLWMTDGAAFPVVKRIASLGAPVLAIPIVGVADVLAAARIVGEALGDPAGGERLARSLRDAVAAARERVAGRRPVRVLFVVGRDPLVVAGPGSYPDELVRIAGGDDVVGGDRPWPVYSLERAIADDPALVIDGAIEEPADGIHRLDAIPAVKRGSVYRLRDDTALRPGPRLVRALDELGRALHGRVAR
jgi:iron complex transport system substrate-binding protein